LDLESDLQNHAKILFAAGFFAFTLEIQTGNLEFMISKSGDLKTQIHLQIQDYNFNEDSKSDKIFLKDRIWTQFG